MNQEMRTPSVVEGRQGPAGSARRGSSWGLVALAVSAFAIGTTEFMTNGLLLTLADELAVPVATTGLLTTGYAAGIVVGGPVLAALTLRTPRKRLLMTLMVIFILGNLVCALAPFFGILVAGRFVSAISHGAFFGAASVVAASLVPAGRRAAAIALLFTGLTLANVLGMPLGTFVGQQFGWRESFALVVVLGFVGLAGIVVLYGAGLVIGTWSGGRAADRYPIATIAVLLVLLIAALITQSLLAGFPALTAVLLFVVGAAGFGLIPPLQNRVLTVAGSASTMISTANIAAFNLGAVLGSLAGLVIFAVTARARSSRQPETVSRRT
ncbi:MFS transporter [Nonomuraea sp. LP-02]|uniref:MFS transporter n=1 Tax=Nonomuraea sp. LP-02 TaxID=3097960 RepID=UPI002E364020|nr:MFS transporter [Nonomuraea sp. LP-02]MED7931180.1 MFS transporter [Nonomuraea sp. LP-02]